MYYPNAPPASAPARFINGPSPKPSLTSRPRDAPANNPSFSGILLAIVAYLVRSSTFIQKLFWRLNKFHTIKDLPELEGYSARWDSTVIPIAHFDSEEESKELTLLELPKPRNRRDGQAYYTTADYHDAYVSGRLTPSDVAEVLLPLITRRKARGKGSTSRYSVAYLDVQPEIVRAAARASTERYRAERPLSVLDGVPIAVKDEVNVKGHAKSLGSALDFKDANDATDWCVKQWEDAGAVILGKTNMHELGLDTSNNNTVSGTPLNPHNESYYCGGSSGGSGCTAAQGICPIVLGVDGGGSIRIPSSFCGLYGLKTSQGRVSVWPAEVGANTLAVSGPMAPNIDDLELAYRVMARPCPTDYSNRHFPSTLTRRAVEGGAEGKKYLGIDRDWVALSDPEVLEMYNAAVEYYIKEQGYEAVDVKIPLQSENEKAFTMTILAESMSAVSKDKLSKLQYQHQILLYISGIHGTAQDFISCNRLRERAMRHLAWLWEQYPGMLLLTPTTPCAGWKIAKSSDITDGYGISNSDMTLRTMEYTCFGNWVGTPAITCPVGYSKDKIPVGIMALGEWGSEDQLIRFGKVHEGFLGPSGVRRPTQEGCWVDVLGSVKA